MKKQKYGYGFKFLNPYGATKYDGDFVYNLPLRHEKYSTPTNHPAPAARDGKSCGPGRLHIMNFINAQYAPRNWQIWFARYKIEDFVGGDREKTGVASVELRRIPDKVFWKICRMGYLRGANLYGADLYGANLYGADLRWANLDEFTTLDDNTKSSQPELYKKWLAAKESNSA